MLSPSWLLALLCCCAALLFGDRGLLSSNAVSGGDARDQSGIRATFDLSIAATGWIYASVMIGLAISAPAAAHYGQRCNALRMVGLGVATSGLGAALTAAAPTFPIMLVGRVVTGMGCGPFISFASPLIEDSAPLENKTTFLALLFLCLPVGFAGGFIWGSAVALAWGWRAAFWTEALIMIMYGVICLCIPRPNDVRKHQSTSDASGSTLKKDLNQLIRSPVVVLAMLALALLNGSIGGFSFYGPKAAKTLYDLQAATADTLFGAITVAMGIVGTLSGGAALDLMGANVRMALIISSVGLGLAAVALSTAFGIAKCLWTFSIGLAIGEGAMFATSAPATAVLLWSVPARLRPSALALSEIANHLLGDVPLPPLLGRLQQRMGNWKLTMFACTSVLATAAAVFAIAICSSPPTPVEIVPLDVDSTEDAVMDDSSPPFDHALNEPLLDT